MSAHYRQCSSHCDLKLQRGVSDLGHVLVFLLEVIFISVVYAVVTVDYSLVPDLVLT